MPRNSTTHGNSGLVIFVCVATSHQARGEFCDWGLVGSVDPKGLIWRGRVICGSSGYLSCGMMPDNANQHLSEPQIRPTSNSSKSTTTTQKLKSFCKSLYLMVL